MSYDEESFDCGACNECANDKAEVDCGHLFCYGCIRKRIKITGSHLCPTCYTPFRVLLVERLDESASSSASERDAYEYDAEEEFLTLPYVEGDAVERKVVEVEYYIEREENSEKREDKGLEGEEKVKEVKEEEEFFYECEEELLQNCKETEPGSSEENKASIREKKEKKRRLANHQTRKEAPKEILESVYPKNFKNNSSTIQRRKNTPSRGANNSESGEKDAYFRQGYGYPRYKNEGDDEFRDHHRQTNEDSVLGETINRYSMNGYAGTDEMAGYRRSPNWEIQSPQLYDSNSIVTRTHFRPTTPGQSYGQQSLMTEEPFYYPLQTKQEQNLLQNEYKNSIQAGWPLIHLEPGLPFKTRLARKLETEKEEEEMRGEGREEINPKEK